MSDVEARFSKFTLQLLQESGWYPGRDVFETVEWPEGFELLSVAIPMLREFGHLIVGKPGPGITCARSTVHFDPKRAEGENDLFVYYEEILDRKLCPLGMVDNGYLYLATDENGIIFLLMDTVFFVDEEFDQALEKLLTGIMSLRVDESTGKW